MKAFWSYHIYRIAGNWFVHRSDCWIGHEIQHALTRNSTLPSVECRRTSLYFTRTKERIALFISHQWRNKYNSVWQIIIKFVKHFFFLNGQFSTIIKAKALVDKKTTHIHLHVFTRTYNKLILTSFRTV